MTRIASGVTDQGLYFVALDATDFTTRETGLTGFTVYRSRNGGTATAMTTPTVTELDATNMPGVYFLLCDEDMTITAGDAEQEMTFHITKTGMAPVTKTISLFRPAVSAGETLTVTSGIASADAVQISGDSAAADNLEAAFDETAGPVPLFGIVDQGTAQSATSTTVVIRAAAAFADDAVVGCTIGVLGSTQGYWQFREITDSVGATDTVTVDAFTVTPSGTITYKIFGGAPAASSSAAAIRDAVGLASANLDTQLGDIDTNAVAIKAKTDQLAFGAANAVNANITHVITDPVQANGATDTNWGGAP